LGRGRGGHGRSGGLLADVPGERYEEPVHPDHVPQPLGAFQRQLPVEADVRRPLLLIPVLDAEHGLADRAEHVVPRRGPGLAARPESAQQAQPHQYRQPVPRGDGAAERQRGQLAGRQQPVPRHRAYQLPVTPGQVRRRHQHRGLIPAAVVPIPAPVPAPRG